MRRFLPLLRLLAASDIRFEAEVGADYIDSFERFTLECSFDGTGRMTFVAEEPEDIAGLSGSCIGTEGAVEFDDTVLAFPLMADGRLSPLAGPWVLVKALKEGAITAVSREGELLHLTVDDSYADGAAMLNKSRGAWENRVTTLHRTFGSAGHYLSERESHGQQCQTRRYLLCGSQPRGGQ